MKDEAPDTNPGPKNEVIVPLRHDDVVDRIREDGNRTRHADDDEWLCCEESIDTATQDLSQEDFVDAKGVVRSCEHIKRKGESREKTKRSMKAAVSISEHIFGEDERTYLAKYMYAIAGMVL